MTEAAEKLKRAGRLYPCFESEAELRAKRDHRVKRGQPAVYDRAMLRLTPAQLEAAEAGGKRPYWRFRLSDRTVEWRDLVLGHREVALPSLSDPIVVQADGTPTRAFAGIVDDLATGITDLVRGDTQVTASAVAIDIYEALGGDASHLRFAHLPPLEDAGEKRLARRVDARTLRSLRHDGVEGAALAAYLARIGTPMPPEVASLQTLAETFDVSQFRGAADTVQGGDAAGAQPPRVAVAEFCYGSGSSSRRRDRFVLARGARRTRPAERGARLVGRGGGVDRAAGNSRTRFARDRL